MNDLDRLVALGQGLVTTARAVGAGVTEDDLRQATSSGALRRVRRGIYADPDLWDPAPPWERYRLTVRGVLLTNSAWSASHHAALVLHGVAVHGVDLTLVDVVADVRTSRSRNGLHVHRGRGPFVDLDGVRTVPVAEACVLTAAASGVEAGVVSMDAALHDRRCTVPELEAAAAARARSAGAAGVRAAVRRVDPRSESPGESRTRLLLENLGAEVRSQVEIHDAQGFVGRVDLLVGDRVVVEFDGLTKYAGADGRDALVREKRREERLRDAGYRVIRVVWSDLSRPADLLARVRAALLVAA